jgi:ADP-ribose pyrophosphatase
MFDGSYKTFEMLRRPDTVDIIPVTEDKKIIVGVQEQPGRKEFVGIPAGRVDKGEDPISAAERELLEETGYKAKEFKLLYTAQPTGSFIDWMLYGFVARGCTKVADQNLDSGEKIKLKLLSFDEFIELASSKDFRDLELSLKVLRGKQNPKAFEKLKKIILG